MVADNLLDLMNLDRALTPEERRRLLHPPKAKKTGHIAPPGTGPAGETCGSCDHKRRRLGVQGHFLKCGLNEANWTGGYGTDIRAKDAACKMWLRTALAGGGE